MTIGRSLRLDELTQYAIAHPDGFTMPEATADLGWSLSQYDRAVKDVRTLCGKFDTITLVCVPAGKHQPWTYRLVGTMDDAAEWVTIQSKIIDTRIDTEIDVLTALLRSVDVRTIEGRRIKLKLKTFVRLREDLADMVP